MGEILPDGVYQEYQAYCKNCNAIITTNMQGNEIGTHDCKSINNWPSNETIMAMGKVSFKLFSLFTNEEILLLHIKGYNSIEFIQSIRESFEAINNFGNKNKTT